MTSLHSKLQLLHKTQLWTEAEPTGSSQIQGEGIAATGIRSQERKSNNACLIRMDNVLTLYTILHKLLRLQTLTLPIPQ